MTSPNLPHTPSIPSDLPQFRPSPIRAATLATPIPNHSYKHRATSQPAGERIPARTGSAGGNGHNAVESGKGSPGAMYGVIGGSRTPSKPNFPKNGNGNGIATRANSFSAAELRAPRNVGLTRALSRHEEERPSRSRSTSPFPTFSPTSSPSASPRDRVPEIHHSPPRVNSNVSRSRSQSLAVGARPVNEKGFPMSLTSLDSPETGYIEESNMSPFSRAMPYLGVQDSKFRSPTRGMTIGAWGTSAPQQPASGNLSSSVAKAFGGFQPTYSTVVGGFDPPSGARSGASSRRHSVSVVGGPGGRRDFLADMAMTSPNRGLMGFTDEELLPEQLGNALNLEIDEHRKRGVEIEVGKGRGRDITTGMSSSLPKFDPLSETHPSTLHADSMPFVSRSPIRGRESIPGAPGERATSRDSKDSSSRSRFTLETPKLGSKPGSESLGPPGSFRGMPSSPPRGRDLDPVGPIGMRGPGPIGGPPMDPRAFSPQMYGRPAFGSPTTPTFNSNRPPPPFGFPPPRPNPALSPGYGPSPGFYSPNAAYQPYFPPPASPPQPSSPSFSSLSLADLGRGSPLNALPPNTPLYIVTFKAGRRDVYYCPDPTLLISNGDRVIVEADRGSDLGTVIYDQLTPVDVREWQEKQATAALLSGASQHQPPGMATLSQAGGAPKPKAGGSGMLAGADLATLLAGVGSQLDPALGIGGQGRGPLAKEIMPKRIFAKSSQGPEEQARMMEKMKDEYDALMICREKAAQRGLPMQIVDAEYQWDRRKLTFYFKADKRIDFRDLTKENFRIFKSRIWMSMVPKDDPRGM